jgi:hypothetical protein
LLLRRLLAGAAKATPDLSYVGATLANSSIAIRGRGRAHGRVSIEVRGDPSDFESLIERATPMVEDPVNTTK